MKEGDYAVLVTATYSFAKAGDEVRITGAYPEGYTVNHPTGGAGWWCHPEELKPSKSHYLKKFKELYEGRR